MTKLRPNVDKVDDQILDRLRKNAREPAASIAKHVKLTPGAVARRITRLEERGIIAGYTVAINHDQIGSSIEAYVELSFAGNADVHAFLKKAIKRPEVREAMTIAGDPDALIRFRVQDVTELRKAVINLRTSGPVTGSKTLIVIGRWWHGAHPAEDD